MTFNEDRLILTLTDGQLEDLVKKWIARIGGEYVGFEQASRSADMGRDAVGFLSDARYDGGWHNYQCKQLTRPLGIDKFALELGKMFYHHCEGAFTLPTQYVFVAPNGGVGQVNRLIDRPAQMGAFLINHWDKYCRKKITSGETPLSPEIMKAVQGYDFTAVKLWKASELVERPHMRAVMMDHMDIDPGEAPIINDEDVPAAAADHEHAYIGQLVAVFGDHRGVGFTDLAEVIADEDFAPEMTLARRRYLEHRLFGLHYRDSLSARHIHQVDRDVHDKVIELYRSMKRDRPYDRLTKVIEKAADTLVSGPLGKHNRVSNSVKQGACHHFANTGVMPWK